MSLEEGLCGSFDRNGDDRVTFRNFVDDILARVLPREVNEARREMDFFDGPGGMFARMIPGAPRPKARTPTVTSGDSVIFDFGALDARTFDATFNALNDVVMGGASDAEVTLEREGYARLAGETEDVRGGFASFKCRDFERPLDLSAYEGVRLTCRGDGKTYKVILYDNDESWGGVAFHQTFVCPSNGEFSTVDLKFSDFVPVQRGRGVAKGDSGYRTTTGKNVMSMQFMLSKFEYGMERKNTGYAPGPFEFELKRVEAYK